MKDLYDLIRTQGESLLNTERDVAEAQARLAAILSKKVPPMKYALESLPELVGKQQFLILIDALGLSEYYSDIRSDGPQKVGEFFAEAVCHKADVNRQKRLEAERQLYAALERKPQKSFVEPRELAHADEQTLSQSKASDGAENSRQTVLGSQTC